MSTFSTTLRPRLASTTFIRRVNVSHVWVALRIVMAWTFAWVFADVIFGLGFPTDAGWIHGGNPIDAFVSFSTNGPLSGFYSYLAASLVVKVLLVSALFIVATGLILGTWFRIAAFLGAGIYLVMWSARFPPTHNPITDDHLMGALIMVGLALSNAGSSWSLAEWWRRVPFVTNNWFLT